jgi:hypothetical protein
MRDLMVEVIRLIAIPFLIMFFLVVPLILKEEKEEDTDE